MSPQHLITPAPRSTVTADGTLLLTSGTQVVAGPGAEAVAGAFAGWLRAGTGWAVPVLTSATGGPVISFGIDSAHPDGSEAYTLTVDDAGVRLSAVHAAGLFHASSSLRQLLPAALESGYTATAAEDIPVGHVEVRDAPRFAYRGIMLDVARSYYPIDEIRRLIDVMTRFKFNVLHLHLADDQSWRIELDTPEDNPTGIDFTELARIGKDGAVNREGWGLGPGRTGYYTKDDYRLIVAYAAERFVTVVPEFDVPGHVNSALAAIPELNPDGIATSPTATGEVGFSTLYNDNPLTRPFVAEVFRQLAELTPGPYLHLGGDEALVTSKEDFVAMVTDFAASVAATGKTVMGWNEYARPSCPPAPSSSTGTATWNRRCGRSGRTRPAWSCPRARAATWTRSTWNRTRSASSGRRWATGTSTTAGIRSATGSRRTRCWASRRRSGARPSVAWTRPTG